MFPTMGCTMALVIFLLVTPSFGYYTFKSKIPNGDIVPHPCKANYMWAGVGHLNPYGSGENNQFGHDFDEAGYKWTEELCRHDSDGDGRSNGEELGDPNCTWMEGAVPERVTGITHPGICDPFGEGICTGKDDYVDCDVKSFDDSCEVIKNADVKSAEFRFKEVEIPNTETNYYCQYFDLPNDGDYHIVADQGLIDQHDVVHHMILYGCPDNYEGSPTDDSPNPCDMNGENRISCSSMISIWSVGVGGTCFGEDMGYRIGLKGVKKVKLEIHYNNPSLVSGYKDSTGMRIYYQPEKPGVQDLATFMLGQTFLDIPPGEKEVEFYGSCHGDCSQYIITKPMTVVSTYNHMHYMGRKQRTEVIRDGRVVKVLADDTQYSYDNPTMHSLDEPFEIMAGDEIATTCTYSSMSKKHWVFYGDATSDEMCFAFIVVYPASALPVTTYCGSHGPLSTCEIYNGTPKYDCDWIRFTNLSNPEMMEHYKNLQDTCHFDGTCRRECKETIDEIKRHPCMSKEMWPLVRQFMDSYTEGSQFIGKIHSCDGAHHDDDDMDCKRDCGHMCDGRSFDSSASHDKDGDDDWEMESSAAILAPMTAAILVTSFLSAAMTTVVSF